MGERGANRAPATSEDLAEMRRLADEAVAAGAIGFASSRLLIHRTKSGDKIPSYAAEDRELQAIAGAFGDAGTGLVQMVLDVPHAGWKEELDHLIAVAESSGRPATFTFGFPNDAELDWEEALGIVNAARARGIEIIPQLLPRPIGMVMGFELSTHPFSLCPSYRPLADLPLDEQLAILRDRGFREKLVGQPPAEGNPLAMMTRNWDWIFPLGDPPAYEPAPGSSIGAQARAQGVAPEKVAFDLMMNGGDGQGMLLNALGNLPDGKLDLIVEMMKRDDIVIGLGDGGAHYAAICDASYPTFMLAHLVRDRTGEKLPLATAIRALTAKPAETAGLGDRGRLAPGYKADVNIIDMDRIRLHAPVIRYDLPSGGRRLDQLATGFVATICSGEIIRRDDSATGARPGRLVRGEQAAPGRASASADQPVAAG
jgi:N-acyl-D-aspartate/D-glutamate deacylase